MKKIVGLVLSICLLSLSHAGEVGPMLPQMPAPKGTKLIYETHFNQIDVVTGNPENFYLEMFMGKPYWMDAKGKKGPAVLVKGRSNNGDKINEFEELYVIVGSECDELSGKIQKLNPKTHIARRAAVEWEYLSYTPRQGKIYPRDVSSYEVIATQMCRELNPYFEAQYNEHVKNLINKKEKEQRIKDGNTGEID